MSTELVASIVHSPTTFSKVYKKEFLEKINEKSALYYPEADPNGYNFKRRFLKAKKIPASFVIEDEEGGYTVFSQNLKRRFNNMHDRTRYHYHVYKTRYGYWICTCTDFAFFNPRPCKHIIRTILYERGFREEHDARFQARIAFCLSDEIRNLEGVFDI